MQNQKNIDMSIVPKSISWVSKLVGLYLRHNQQGFVENPNFEQLLTFTHNMLKRFHLLQNLPQDPQDRKEVDIVAYQVRHLLVNFGRELKDTMFNLFGANKRGEVEDKEKKKKKQRCWFIKNWEVVKFYGLVQGDIF